MVVATEKQKITYNGNSVTTVFSYDFEIPLVGDERIILKSATGVETLQANTTHYSITVGASAGGNVTMVTAPATGEILLIKRDVDITQPTDYVENDSFPAEVHENALDRRTFVEQQLDERLDRAVLLDETSPLIGITFPNPAAGRSLVWNATADGLINGGSALGTWRGDWTASTAYNEADVIRNGTDNNIYIAITTFTSHVSVITTDISSGRLELLIDVASVEASEAAAAASAAAALVSQNAAAASAAAAASDAVSTAADVLLTAADVVSTAADVVLTNADVVQAAAIIASAADKTITLWSGDNSTTVFTLPFTVSREEDVDVHVTGVYQNTDTYSVFGTSLTFTEAPPTGTNNIEAKITLAIAPTAAIDIHASVTVATAAALTVTQSGTGVGATLTNATTQAAISIDGVALSSTQRVLVKNQADASQNGIYTVTTVGTGSTNWVLTRGTDADQDVEVVQGIYVLVDSGDTNSGNGYIMTSANPLVVDTDDQVFEKFAQGGGTTDFINLADTPSTYSGQALKTLRVNSGATDIEFYTALADVVSDTTPQLGGMLDMNGQHFGDGTLELLRLVETGSAVNEITITNAATGTNPVISATGNDTNVGLSFTPKGSGNTTFTAGDIVLTEAGALVDGRDLTTDGTKLDAIEASADVTDTTNVDAAGAVMDTDFNARTILAAVSANTPTPLTIAEQTLVGRITGGEIDALTVTESQTLLNVADGSTANPNALDNLVEDLSPVLGANLDTNGFAITQPLGNIQIIPGTTSYVEMAGVKYYSKQSQTLTDNQTSATAIFNFSWPLTETAAFVDYIIARGAGNRTVGTLYIANDGTTTEITDTGVEMGATGLTFTAVINASNMEVHYTSTSTGTAPTMEWSLRTF